LGFDDDDDTDEEFCSGTVGIFWLMMMMMMMMTLSLYSGSLNRKVSGKAGFFFGFVGVEW
jgi:hypothetical protein